MGLGLRHTLHLYEAYDSFCHRTVSMIVDRIPIPGENGIATSTQLRGCFGMFDITSYQPRHGGVGCRCLLSVMILWQLQTSSQRPWMVAESPPPFETAHAIILNSISYFF